MKAAAGATGSVPHVDADTDGAEPTDAVDIVEPTPREGPTSRFTERVDEDSQERQETLSQLRARHVKEMKEHKKAMDKLGKKHKDEVERRTKEINERHAEELAALRKAKAAEDGDSDEGRSGTAGGAGEEGDREAASVADLLAGSSIYGASSGADRKLSKSQKKKDKKKAQDAEREARIAAEKEAMGPTDRDVEAAKLDELLKPHQLRIKEIPADGHCMYRALEDQLVMTSEAPKGGFQGLRELAASFMRSHPDDYLPFVVEEREEPAEEFEKYCAEVEGSAAWGGQVELGALANALERHIAVFSTDLGCLDMGEQFRGASPSLRVCYLRHAYGMGEHYNSLVAAPVAANEDDSGGEDEEEEG